MWTIVYNIMIVFNFFIKLKISLLLLISKIFNFVFKKQNLYLFIYFCCFYKRAEEVFRLPNSQRWFTNGWAWPLEALDNLSIWPTGHCLLDGEPVAGSWNDPHTHLFLSQISNPFSCTQFLLEPLLRCSLASRTKSSCVMGFRLHLKWGLSVQPPFSTKSSSYWLSSNSCEFYQKCYIHLHVLKFMFLVNAASLNA